MIHLVTSDRWEKPVKLLDKHHTTPLGRTDLCVCLWWFYSSRKEGRSRVYEMTIILQQNKRRWESGKKCHDRIMISCCLLWNDKARAKDVMYKMYCLCDNCRCDERRKTKAEESTRLAYTTSGAYEPFFLRSEAGWLEQDAVTATCVPLSSVVWCLQNKSIIRLWWDIIFLKEHGALKQLTV